jgi:ParB family chromosome partitioning protein
MATQASVAGEILNIPLVDIVPSKTNPRGAPSPEGLEDLAADIERRGVQQPITVRPAPAKGKFEIIFGERRWRASKKAQQPTIPCVVRDLSNQDAYEVQLVENLQREDLHPLDEAEGFRRFYNQIFKQTRLHDQTITLLAERLGKKRAPQFIAQRLKLNDLIPAAKAAFRKNDLLLGHAGELARLRSEEQQEALEWLLKNYEDVRCPSGWKKTLVIPGVPELRLWIRQKLFMDLTKAPFDTSDGNLNPKMGPCTTCSFKTGNQPALFGDVAAGETCAAPGCWKTKHHNSLIQIANARAKELGVKRVLKVGFGYESWNKAKAPVDVYIEYNSSARIVKAGKECKDTQPGIVTWVEHARAEGVKEGDAVLVCPKATECPAHKNVDSRAERKHKTFEQTADTRIKNLREETPQKIRASLIAAVVAAATKKELALSRRHPVMFGLMAAQMHTDLFFDRHRDLCKVLGTEPQIDRYKSKDWRGTSKNIFKGNPVALMVAMTVMHCYHVGGYRGDGGDPLPKFLQLYRVNAKAVEDRVKAATAEKIAAIQQSLKKRQEKKRSKAS